MTKRNEERNHITGQIIGEFVNRQGNALNTTAAGIEQLLKAAEQYTNVGVDFKQGRMFEIIESTKFNAAAAKAGSSLKAVMTETLGMPHHQADIWIQNSDGDVLRQIQAKSSNSAAYATNYIRNDNYHGMDRLVNKEHTDKVKNLVDRRLESNGINQGQYEDVKKHLKGEIEHDHVKSGGTTYNEAVNAAENADKFGKSWMKHEAVAGASKAMLTGALAGAFTGAVIDGSISAVKGEFSVTDTSKAAIRGAVGGGTVGGIAYGLKYVGKNIPMFKNGNMVAVLASSAVSVTELTYQLLKSDVKLEEYIEKLGSTAVSGFSSIVLTTAGTMLLGPVGGAIAGTVMLIGMKQMYQAFTSARHDLKLTQEQRLEAEEMAQIAKEVLAEETAQLQAYFHTYREQLLNVQNIVQAAIQDDRHTADAILSISETFGLELAYKTQNDFDDFMMSGDTLIL